MKNLTMRVFLVLAMMLAMTISFTTQQVSAAGEQWLSGWDRRIQITIDHTKVGSDLSNFPVMLRLSPASGVNKANVSEVFNNLGANSKKIAITTSDGATQCYVEIAKWDNTNREAN
jgi:hypothetical protein